MVAYKLDNKFLKDKDYSLDDFFCQNLAKSGHRVGSQMFAEWLND